MDPSNGHRAVCPPCYALGPKEVHVAKPRSSESENKMLREFFLGFVKVHVLHHARRGPIYGVWVLEELARHDYHLSPGTLYPLLHSLEETGYLERDDRVVEGKVRKYYRITAQGEAALAEARQKIRELVDEMLEPVPVKGAAPERKLEVAARR